MLDGEFFFSVLKILIPAIISLSLVWLRHWYVKNQEEKAYKKALWKALKAEIDEISNVLNELEILSKTYINHKVRITSFHISKSQIEISNKLIHLDPENAISYLEYIDYAEICINGFKFLEKIIFEKLKTSEDSSKDICKAIMYQCQSLQKDLIDLARQQAKLIEITGRNNKIDNSPYVLVAEKKVKVAEETLAKIQSEQNFKKA